MYSIYRLINKISGNEYIGITKVPLWKRFSQHKYSAKSGKKSKLYDAMRSYGNEAFDIELIDMCETQQEACTREIELIAKSDNLYNLAAGGEGGFNITNIHEWKQKLSAARKGGKPFLGKSHSEETKEKCRKAAALRWASKRAESNVLG